MSGVSIVRSPALFDAVLLNHDCDLAGGPASGERRARAMRSDDPAARWKT